MLSFGGNRRPQPLSSEVDWTFIANSTLSHTNNTSIMDISNTNTSVMQGILAGFFLLICIWLANPRVPEDNYQRGFLFRERAREARERRERMGRLSDPVLRKTCIQKSLIVKRVVTADQDGTLTLGEPLNAEHAIDEDDVEDDHSASYHSLTDDETHTCVICLEPFRVGDVVAWSKKSAVSEEPECLHVFHQECILPWLENAEHNDCPNCRSVILQEDELQDDESEDDAEEHAVHETSASTAFVIMNGLISRVKRASYSLIGQTIDLEHGHAGHDTLSSLSEPSRLRRVFSLGDRKQATRLRSSMRRRSAGWRSTSYGSSDGSLDLSIPIGLRRAVSAGPGSPLRNTSSWMLRRSHEDEQTEFPSSNVDGTSLPGPPPSPLRRTNSSTVSRSSRAQDISERGEEDEIRVISTNLVSWRDLNQSENDHIEEDHIINEIA